MRIIITCNLESRGVGLGLINGFSLLLCLCNGG
jgi:hypothetical protein